MSKTKRRRTRDDILAKREADDRRRARLGLTARKPKPPLDMESSVFSRHGLLLPPFSRRGLTIARR